MFVNGRQSLLFVLRVDQVFPDSDPAGHLVIQIAMGWDNDHLYEFRVGRRSFGIPDPDLRDFQDGPDDASAATLADIFAKGGKKAFEYMYDFGDSWNHSIKVESVAEAAPDRGYPRLIAAKGACPPEDVGGPWGYADFLKAIGDPRHERHDDAGLPSVWVERRSRRDRGNQQQSVRLRRVTGLLRYGVVR